MLFVSIGILLLPHIHKSCASVEMTSPTEFNKNINCKQRIPEQNVLCFCIAAAAAVSMIHREEYINKEEMTTTHPGFH